MLHGTPEQQEQLKRALGCKGKKVSVDALAAVIEEKAEKHDFLAEVRSSKTITIPAGRRMQLKCKVKCNPEDDQVVYFAPLLSPDGSEDKLVCTETVSKLRRGYTNHVLVDVMNLTGEVKVLRKGTVIGSVHSVSSVLPMTKLFNSGGGSRG